MSGLPDPVLVSFANHVLTDWQDFMAAVDRKMRGRNLQPDQVREALERGYGIDVADSWDQWIQEADA